MEITTEPFKRGDSFVRTFTITQGGAPRQFTNETFRAQLNLATGGKICDLVVTPDPNQTVNKGKITLTTAVDVDTKTWPAPELLVTDIEITKDGVKTSTPNIFIPIEPDQTI